MLIDITDNLVNESAVSNIYLFNSNENLCNGMTIAIVGYKRNTSITITSQTCEAIGRMIVRGQRPSKSPVKLPRPYSRASQENTCHDCSAKLCRRLREHYLSTYPVLYTKLSSVLKESKLTNLLVNVYY